MSFAGGEAGIVVLVAVGCRCVLGVGFGLALLVCSGLGVPEGFLSVIVGVPGCLEVFDHLFCGSVRPYHGLDEDVKGWAPEVGAFRQMRILEEARLLRLITRIHSSTGRDRRKSVMIARVESYVLAIGAGKMVR